MSSFGASLPLSLPHRWPLSRRGRDIGLTALIAGVAILVALTIAMEVPNPNFALAAGLVVGTLGIIALTVSSRYEVTVTTIALYLGLMDGVVKLEAATQGASAIRDVLIGAVCLGAVTRAITRREPIRLPPLSGWVIAFVVLVLVEALNPATHGVAKIVGGFRQQLEWVPFFFFGYALMRSKRRFRGFLLLLGIIATINAGVGTVQAGLSPQQLEKWGPGYKTLINGKGNVSSRVYVDSAHEARIRPMALGSDMGFGGSVGVVALAGTLALVATAGLGKGASLKRSALALILCAGALVGIVTSLARTDVLGGAIAVLVFALLSLSAGRRMIRVFAALAVVAAIGIVVIPALTSHIGGSVFSRYESITPGKAISTSINYREGTLRQIPTDIRAYPFGAGLASVGAGADFGGRTESRVNGSSLSAESQYNYVTVELGLLGLVLWVALSVSIIVLSVKGLRRVIDPELRIYLAAMATTVIAFTIMGFVGPSMSSTPFGPFFWFAVGTFAYWFGGRRPKRSSLSSPTPTTSPQGLPSTP